MALIGALLMGAGATTTWITVGIPNESAHTAIRGTDQDDGIVVLLCALTVVGDVIATRLVTSRAKRRLLGALASIVSLLAVSIGAAFLIGGPDRDTVVKALGIPRELWSQFGAFRTLGPGPYLVVVGGLMAVLGGVLTMVWANSATGPGGSAVA